jgi:hypothetical protein
MVAFDKQIARFVGTRDLDVSTAMRDVEGVVSNLESGDSRTFCVAIRMIRPDIVFSVDSSRKCTTIDMSAGWDISMQKRLQETLFRIVLGNGDISNDDITL